MDMKKKHSLEEESIRLEQQQAHYLSRGYPWYDPKLASAFGRAAKVLRTELTRAV